MGVVAGLSIATSVIGAAGALGGMLGSKQAAKDQKEQLDLQAQIADYQAAQDVDKISRSLQMTTDGIITAIATRSLDLSSPTAMAILQDEFGKAEQDIEATYMNKRNLQRQIDLRKNQVDLQRNMDLMVGTTRALSHLADAGFQYLSYRGNPTGAFDKSTLSAPKHVYPDVHAGGGG